MVVKINWSVATKFSAKNLNSSIGDVMIGVHIGPFLPDDQGKWSS